MEAKGQFPAKSLDIAPWQSQKLEDLAPFHLLKQNNKRWRAEADPSVCDVALSKSHLFTALTRQRQIDEITERALIDQTNNSGSPELFPDVASKKCSGINARQHRRISIFQPSEA